MTPLERIGLAALTRLDSETAHALAIKALRFGLTPKIEALTSPRLATSIAGLDLPNPVGLAAGFDKNAEAVTPLLQSGFGFIEVGAATPVPQPGNPRPRLFRLTEDEAAINRFGFNNEGAEIVAERLSERPSFGVVGINLGANKTSDDKAKDFASVLSTTGPHVDFATVNVSSPNTEKLRDLQGRDALRAVMEAVMKARSRLDRPVPIFLKVAPDLSLADMDDIVAVMLETEVDALIATNTTLRRDGLRSAHAGEAGGLSGAPLKSLATAVLGQFSLRLDGRIPIIGVGGIASAADAYARIQAGASALQLYTGLVYGGIGLAAKIVADLETLLARDGVTVAETVGTQASAAASNFA